MIPIIKLLSEEQLIGSGASSGDAPGDDFNGATLIRVYNSNPTDSVLITIKDSSSAENVTGSVSVGFTSEAFIRKLPSERIFASANTLAVAVAF